MADTTLHLPGQDLAYLAERSHNELPPCYRVNTRVWKHDTNGTFAYHAPQATCTDASVSGVSEDAPLVIARLPQ